MISNLLGQQTIGLSQGVTAQMVVSRPCVVDSDIMWVYARNPFFLSELDTGT